MLTISGDRTGIGSAAAGCGRAVPPFGKPGVSGCYGRSAAARRARIRQSAATAGGRAYPAAALPLIVTVIRIGRPVAAQRVVTHAVKARWMTIPR